MEESETQTLTSSNGSNMEFYDDSDSHNEEQATHEHMDVCTPEAAVASSCLIYSAQLPAILRVEDVLVPVKIDITHNGARFVQSFCWNVNSNMTTLNFASIVCNDLMLPLSFKNKIALQLAEQIQSYRLVVRSLREFLLTKLPNVGLLTRPLWISLNLRHNSIEYNEKVAWDPMDTSISPEAFACKTVSDGGLPSEMESMIAFKIRESMFTNMIIWMSDPLVYRNPDLIEDGVMKKLTPEIKLIPAPQMQEMQINMANASKPKNYDDFSTFPPAPLLQQKDTNAYIWKPEKQ